MMKKATKNSDAKKDFEKKDHQLLRRILQIFEKKLFLKIEKKESSCDNLHTVSTKKMQLRIVDDSVSLDSSYYCARGDYERPSFDQLNEHI